MTSHMNFDQRQARLKMITAQYEVARTKRALAKLGGKVALTSQMNFALNSLSKIALLGQATLIM